MKISIITICYNEPNLRKTCESIVNQSYQDFEWIVIDGGSNQETLDIFNEYKNRINVFISEKDSGIYNAMNKGIKLASGEYLNFLNAGDYYFDKNALKKVSKLLGNEDIVFGNLQLLQNEKNAIKKYPDKIPYGWLMFDVLPHSSSFIKKEMFDNYGLYDESYKIVADWDKSIELIEINKCTYKHVPIVVAAFDCSGISSVYDETQIQERAKVILKYYKNADVKPPSKRVIGVLNIPIIKIIEKFGTTTYYLFGILPILKRIKENTN